MKLICSKSNLLHGVNIVSKAVPTRTTMAILECILIDASAGQIKMTANDMELGIETVIEGDIQEKGIIAIDAKIFSEIVRKLPDNDVTIETDANFQMLISCEKARFHIAGKSGDDFSYLPYIEKAEPGVNESGSYEQKSVPTSKRGSSVLRKTLFQVMDVLIKTHPQDDPVYQFIDKKRAQGKPYYVYMTAGANKFLRIYYGRVKEYLSSLPES